MTAQTVNIDYDTLMTTLRVQRASSRAAILRVFAEQVAERGYSDTSISDVASALGLSKGTVVHHFGSKNQLLLEVHTAYFERRFAEAEYLLGELDDPVSQFSGIVFALLAGHRDDRAASLTFLREFVRYVDGGLSEHVRTERQNYRRLVTRIIEAGVEAGDFETSSPQLVTMQLFGMCNYAWTWYRLDGESSVEEIAELFAKTILVGLRPSGQNEDMNSLDARIREGIAVVRRAPGRLPPEYQ
ncbi:TetR/AcrR family transcriptional regulator [Rhodococcus qingshengii]|uniref:TetR/AcrR family transcriptional regulator n=1 Tax=Rhodococcus qingshengii TaxID=334542 RepID=UPI0024B8F7BC|nr:TetR/AcrR family transcriptional regulator [Rhodococcus qingshengii]MDJ0490926.1 TetR/AcrR family transcriptional regulator [Rhodococcus qingshengii]